MKKAVHFGAGSIGLGLMGERLHESGYHITFLDVNEDIVQQLNRERGYDLFLINHSLEKVRINNVDAVNSISDTDRAIEKIIDCDLLTTSVWAGNLSKISTTIARGLERRFEKKKTRLEILACENAIFASNILKEEVKKVTILSDDQLDQVATFVNTAIARMVIDSTSNGMKSVNIADDFEIDIAINELNDKSILPIKGADYTDNLGAFIERKLFIVNSAHCIAGYLGVLSGKKYVRECFENPVLCAEIRKGMLEAANYIALQHGFSMDSLHKFIDKTINRYVTPGVFDDLTRVCRSPIRKVGKNDRLVLPIRGCEEKGLENTVLCKGLAAAYAYDYKDDKESCELQEFIRENGIEEAIKKYSEISETELLNKIIKIYQLLKEDK